MEEYGYNPNNDPTLPVVAATDDSVADNGGGYRGWGAAGAAMPARKTSTTMSGNTMRRHPSEPYAPTSPTQKTLSDGANSDQPLMSTRYDLDGPHNGGYSDTVAAGGLAAGAAAAGHGVKRGPSNASSTYSVGDHSQGSGEPPLPPVNSYHNQDQFYPENAYYQPGPYDAQNPYGSQQPVIRDNPARRNTRIQEVGPGAYNNVGRSGIAQNF